MISLSLSLNKAWYKMISGPFLAQQTDFKTLFASSASSQRPSSHKPPDASSENLSNSHSEERGITMFCII